ncbi:unnamed protein product [Linum tenue]|uniref:Uncharacterized protein n=1 Tax=Linum tenue TaxID=586396 RepID=A0AAV0PBA8_9ROSI|nr:unnamed protein product [Linum tenue]
MLNIASWPCRSLQIDCRIPSRIPGSTPILPRDRVYRSWGSCRAVLLLCEVGRES